MKHEKIKIKHDDALKASLFRAYNACRYKSVGQYLTIRDTPPSPLARERGRSPDEGSFPIYLINPSPALRASSPARGEENAARGFTLIELLVVVLIIGILTAVAFPQYQKAVRKAQMLQVLAIGRSINDAQHMYFLQHGTYANKIELLDISFPQKELNKYWIRLFVGSNPRVSIAKSDKKKDPIEWAWDFWYDDFILCSAPNSEPLNQQVCKSLAGGQERIWSGYKGYYLIKRK